MAAERHNPQPPITPHLTVSDAAAAIEFYRRAFGAKELFRMPAPDGRLLHASLSINGGTIMLVDDFPEYHAGRAGHPRALGGTPVTIHLTVDDVDTVWARALKAGAAVVMPLADMFWGDRYGVLEDPAGHRWSLATHKRDVSYRELENAVTAGVRAR